MCKSQQYNNEREITKLFSEVSSREYKNIPVVKEEVKMNFNHYKNANEKKNYRGGNGANLSDGQGRLKQRFKCNSAKHFACDCAGSRDDSNIVMDSDQVQFTLFNVDTHY